MAKQAAFAIQQKALGYDKSMHRVTFSKPRFDEHSRKKAQGAEEVTLVEHVVFIEGALRVLAGKATPQQFVEWPMALGLTELDRFAGPACYEIVASG